MVIRRGVQSLKLSTKVTAFKKISLLIGGAKHSNWGGQAPWNLPLGVGPVQLSHDSYFLD